MIKTFQSRKQKITTLAIFAILTVMVATVIIFIATTKKADAAPVVGFNAGKIIDDEVFTNSNTMSADQIQSFLNSKVPVCDTAGTQQSELGGGTRAQWGAAHGTPAPFICLKDYSENGKTAAQIIYRTAQDFLINPQTLLVLLQKEQGLVTDTWPTSSQYKSATGYGCPDSTPGVCDTNYKNFTSQVQWAARMFRAIMDNSPTWYKPYLLGNNYILYSPTDGCGGSNVNIQNRSTQALYNYTPYQPNQASLDAGYGQGDGCSSHGNRNFYQYFKDWFGSTYNPVLSWQVVDLNIYDEGKNAILSTDNLHAGERLWVSLKVKNIGSTTWYKDGANPATLGTSNPRDHASPYCDTTWLSCNRVTTIRESSVAPGEDGHFEFYAAASNVLGEFREYFAPVLENKGWTTNDTGFHIYTQTKSDYAWQWGSLAIWSDAAHTTPIDLNHVPRGQRAYVTVYAKNTSATVWNKGGSTPMRLATSNPKDRSSKLCDVTWINCARIASMDESQVVPGQTASFSFTFQAPSTAGEYREYLRPVLEMKGWTSDDINHIYMNVQ
jgi:hypothetical protein